MFGSFRHTKANQLNCYKSVDSDFTKVFENNMSTVPQVVEFVFVKGTTLSGEKKSEKMLVSLISVSEKPKEASVELQP